MFYRLLLLLVVFWIQITNGFCQAQTPALVGRQGVLDLSSYAYQTAQPLTLTGQWWFRWKQFTDATGVQQGSHFITVPGEWTPYTGSSTLLPQNFGYATYGLKILLPDSGQVWSLRLPPIRTAYKLFANGKLVAQSGRPDTSRAMVPEWSVKLVALPVAGRELFLVLHVSNFNFVHGGIWQPIRLGTPQAIQKQHDRDVLVSSLLFGGLFLMGFYHFSLYFLRRKDKGPLYFGIVCLMAGLREFLSGEYLFFLLFPMMDWEWLMRLVYDLHTVILVCFSLFIYNLYPRLFSTAFLRFIVAFNVSFCLFSLLAPNHVYVKYLFPLMPVVMVQCVYILYIVIRAFVQRLELALPILLGLLLIFLFVCHDTLVFWDVIQAPLLSSLGVFLFIFCQSVALATRFSNAFQRADNLSVELVSTSQAYDQKRQEAEHQKTLEELKTRFFSNITHEFRTPLSLIILPAERLLHAYRQQAAPDPTLLQSAISTIHRNASQLLQLVNQLLDLSKLEAGSMAIAESRGSLTDFFENRIDSFRLLAESKGIELFFESVPAPAEAIFDADKLEKITYNLLSNALKYTQSDGHIRVTLTLPTQPNGQTGLRLVVADTGLGIPADGLPHIFDRFYQVDNSLTRSFGGTGIGLALVKELTELMGGQIGVESQPGQGTTFTVDLPLRLTAPEVTRQPVESTLPIASLLTDEPADEKAHHKPLVLIVEDNQDLSRFIAVELEDKYRIISAPNGRVGWDMCRSELPDLVISDVMMPEMDGYTLCRLIKNTPLTNHIAVLLLTAKSALESKMEGLAVGANDYLTKPFYHEELHFRVGNLIQYQQSLRDFHHRRLVQPEPEVSQPEHPFLLHVHEIIEHELTNPQFSVETLATTVAMSSRTLNRKLASLVGMTANEVIRNYRIHKATELLAEGRTISDTAFQVGFESPSYFSKCFKEFYGVSPSEFSGR